MATAAESGTMLLARLRVKPQLTKLEPIVFPGGPKQGNIFNDSYIKQFLQSLLYNKTFVITGCVYEFYGKEGSGKSQALLHLTARCLLPYTWLEYEIGGHGVGLVYVDNDFHFNVLRLAAIMEKQVVKQVVKQTPSKVIDEIFMLQVEQLLKDCLRHLHVIQCTSLTNMLISMATLEKLFAANSNKCVLIIDSISAWYTSCDVIENKKYFPILVEKLQSLVETYKVVSFVSKAALFTKDCYTNSNRATSSNIVHLKHSEYLGKVWTKLVNYRLIFLVSDKTANKSFYMCKDSGFERQETIAFYIREDGLVFT